MSCINVGRKKRKRKESQLDCVCYRFVFHLCIPFIAVVSIWKDFLWQMEAEEPCSDLAREFFVLLPGRPSVSTASEVQRTGIPNAALRGSPVGMLFVWWVFIIKYVLTLFFFFGALDSPVQPEIRNNLLRNRWCSIKPRTCFTNVKAMPI